VPLLGVALTQAAARDPVAAADDPAGGVRSLAVPPWIRGGREHGHLWPVLVHPPQMMALTQAVPTRGALTAPDAASTATEDRVGRREDEHLGPELLPNHGEQRLDQPWTR